MQRAQPTAAHLLMIFQLLLLFFLSALTNAHYLLPSMPTSTESEAVDVPVRTSSDDANIMDGLQDNVPEWKHSSLVDDGDDMQSKMARRKPKFALTKQRAVEIDQSKAVILQVGLSQEKQAFQLLDDGSKNDVKLESTSETSLHLKGYEANHLQEEAAQEATFESLWTDSSTTTQLKQSSEDTLHDGAKHVDDQHTDSSSTANAAQGEHSLWQLLHNGSQHATKHSHSSKTIASPSEEVKLLQDNVAQGEYVFLLDDGGEGVPAHAQTNSPGAPNLKGDQEKVQILHGNAAQGEYSFLLDDDSKYRYPKAKATNLDGDLVDQTTEVDHVKLKEQKGHQVFNVDREKQSPDDEIRMVVSESPDQSLRPSGIYQARRGRFASCIFHPKVCEHRMSEAGRHTLNPTVEYDGGHVAAGGLLRLQSPKRPACCRGKCVDLNRERLHCGRCHSPCGLTQACCNGQCTDLSTDDLNCGQCGQACPDLMTPCQFGMCGYY